MPFALALLLGLPLPVQALLAAVLALVVYGFHPIQRWRYRHLPGPRPRWLVGNLPEIAALGIHEAQARWAQQYGPSPCMYWLGATPKVLTDNPEHARKILARPNHAPFPSVPVGREGRFYATQMALTNGEMWRAARTAWQGFFKQATLNKCAPFMVQCSRSLAGQMGQAADDGRPVDMWRAAGTMTLDVVATTAFGVDMTKAASEPGSAASRLIGALQTIHGNWGLANPRILATLLVPEATRLIRWVTNTFPSRAMQEDIDAKAITTVVAEDLVRRELAHQAEVAGTSGTAAAADGTARPRRPSVVDPGSFLALILPSVGQRLPESGEVLGEEWAAFQARGFIGVGYETTANSISFCVALLAANPDKEAKLLAEIDAFGRARPPAAEDIDASFPYTAAAVKEALRIFPPGVTTNRLVGAGASLGGVPLPDGATVEVCIYSMHRNTRWWADPLAFQPERFLPGTPESEQVVPGAWLAFGDGPRKCIGYRFAMQEICLTLITLYQQFTFRLLPGQLPLKTRVTLSIAPVGGVQVMVERRPPVA